MANQNNNAMESLLPQQTVVIPVPAVLITTADAERVETNHWPDVAKWLQTGQGPVPEVNCNICCQSLTIPGVPTADDAKSNTNGLRERCYITRCNHILGWACLERWVIQCFVLDKHSHPRCPHCREPIYSTQTERDEAYARSGLAAEVLAPAPAGPVIPAPPLPILYGPLNRDQQERYDRIAAMLNAELTRYVTASQPRP